jgi:hypothetical protein
MWYCTYTILFCKSGLSFGSLSSILSFQSFSKAAWLICRIYNDYESLNCYNELMQKIIAKNTKRACLNGKRIAVESNENNILYIHFSIRARGLFR